MPATPARLLCLEFGTCSHRAALHFHGRQADHALAGLAALNVRLEPVADFEAGIQCLLEEALGPAQDAGPTVLLLPHIHALASKATMHPRLELISELSFPLANPPLHIVVREHETPALENAETASIETLWPLLPAELRLTTRKPVASTQEAARAVANGHAAFGVTNECGLRNHQGLRSAMKLRELTIFWLAFAPRRAITHWGKNPWRM